MPTTWVTHCRLTVAPRSCESESPCCSFGKPRPRESQGPARYHWMQSPDEDSQGTIVFSVFLSRPCSQSEYVYRPSGLPPQKALPRSHGLMVPWQQRSLAMMGPTLAKWLLECQTILEFPEDGFGLHQLCPPPPVGEKGVQLWKLALHPTLPGDEGQAQFHAPSSPIMTFIFLAHGSCLCPEEERGSVILLIALPPYQWT